MSDDKKKVRVVSQKTAQIRRKFLPQAWKKTSLLTPEDRRRRVEYHSPALRNFMQQNQGLARSAHANGWFDDLVDNLIDTAEEYGDMFYPGISKGAGVARKLKEKFTKPRRGTEVTKLMSEKKEVKREIAKEAAAVGIQTGAPPSHKRTYFHSSRVIAGATHVVGCELIKLLPAAAYSIGDVVYKVEINPATLPCPKLKRTIRGFERARVSRLSFHLDSACGSTKAGQLAILVDHDPKDPWTSGGELVARNALSHSTCKQHSLYQSSSITIPPSSLLWVDSDTDPDAIRFDTFGTFVIVCTQAITNDVTLGVLSCSYDFVVEQPAENDNLVGGNFFQMAAYGGSYGTYGILDSYTVASQSSIPYHVISASSGQLSIDASGSFLVYCAIQVDGAGTSSTYDNTNATTAGCSVLSFGSTATPYSGVYGTSMPQPVASNMICDRSLVVSSKVVYAESPWQLNILPRVGSLCYFGSNSTWKGTTNGMLQLWIVGLDSLPFATLSAARRAKRAADAIDRAKKMASLFESGGTSCLPKEPMKASPNELELVPMERSTASSSLSTTFSASSSSSSNGVTRGVSSGWYRV